MSEDKANVLYNKLLSCRFSELESVEQDLFLMLRAMNDRWPLPEATLSENISALDEAELADNGLSREMIHTCIRDFATYLDSAESGGRINKITICGGSGKDGSPENVTLDISCGEVICLVGPTGAGKSQLLCDLECLAQGDTPTRRKILLDGCAPDDETRFSIERKLVAQLTQNMNFVMDIPVEDFLVLHARSRLKPEPQKLALEVLKMANDLAGEKFAPATPLTGLSGGQSRALMIADTAMISDSPVVLIDEIENAGVDRRRALDLLLSRNKIVVLATHDPVLALLADRRINIRDGAIKSVLQTHESEKKLLESLLENDRKLSAIRTSLRNGERVNL